MPSKVSEKHSPRNANGTHAASSTEPAHDVVSEIIEEAEIAGENFPQIIELRKIIVHPETVSEILPTALVRSYEKDNQLVEATLPIIEYNIRESIQRNPEILSEAIFPIIGPAIRKAVAEALSQMIQSFNETLEQSVSVKGARWRMEAWRTGKPFGEVVLLKTLIYRVEQVFLIHKKTGILLNHVSAQDTKYSDAEMVSGMLTAIQDFVSDSFESGEGATLDALKVRDLAVWIEYSPDAIIAAVIRGNAPNSLREILTDTVERIQLRHEKELDDFSGDTEHFVAARPILHECLRLKLSPKAQPRWKILRPSGVLAALLICAVLTAGFFYLRDYRRWSNYLSRLKSEDGIAVIESNHSFFSRSEVTGMRSDTAIDPETLLSEYGYDQTKVASHWKIYQDMSPELILARAEKILKPPPTAELKLENGILTIYGTAPNDWLIEARELSQSIAGVSGFKVMR